MGRIGRPSKTFIESSVSLRGSIPASLMLHFDMALRRENKKRSEALQDIIRIYSDNVNAAAPPTPDQQCMFFLEGKCDAKNPVARLGKMQSIFCQDKRFHETCYRRLEGRRRIMDGSIDQGKIGVIKAALVDSKEVCERDVRHIIINTANILNPEIITDYFHFLLFQGVISHKVGKVYMVNKLEGKRELMDKK